MPMGPICTVMVYRRRPTWCPHWPLGRPPSRGADSFAWILPSWAELGPWAAQRPLTGLLTQPITLIRDLDCIRADRAYFADIKADWAAPHPPDTPPSSQISL